MQCKKIKKESNKVYIINTDYDSSFRGVINRKGRPKRNFDVASDGVIKRCSSQKVRLLKKHSRKLNFIISHNKFNYFITLRGINKRTLTRFLDRVKKSDKGLKYLTLASWSKELDLHYHILFYTDLSYDDLEKKMKDIKDYKILDIYNKRGLLKYFKKNINYDTCHILRQNSTDNSELRDKQIEILKYGKLVNFSRNIDREIEIKKPTLKQLNDIRNNYKFLGSFDYKVLGSNVSVERYIIN